MASKKRSSFHLVPAQKLSLFVFLILLIALPLVVLVMKLQQDYRSRAYVPSATPIIITTTLPTATIGRNYQATVSGLDTSGYGSALTMSFANLPAGLAKGPCQIVTPTPNRPQSITPSITSTPLPRNIAPARLIATPSATPTASISQTSPTRISCLITGIPTSTGSFSVVATLSNGRTGLISSRGLSLVVNPVTQITRTPQLSTTPTPSVSPTTPPARPTGVQRRWF